MQEINAADVPELTLQQLNLPIFRLINYLTLSAFLFKHSDFMLHHSNLSREVG